MELDDRVPIPDLTYICRSILRVLDFIRCFVYKVQSYLLCYSYLNFVFAHRKINKFTLQAFEFFIDTSNCIHYHTTYYIISYSTNFIISLWLRHMTATVSQLFMHCKYNMFLDK